MIYNFNDEVYVNALTNMQRRDKINTEMDKLALRDLPHIVIKDSFPQDVPLDEKFFEEFVTENPWLFLHVWIQVEGVALPIQLFYRSKPYENTLPVHLLFVGPPAGKHVGHFHFIRDINALFYHTEKCN